MADITNLADDPEVIPEFPFRGANPMAGTVVPGLPVPDPGNPASIPVAASPAGPQVTLEDDHDRHYNTHVGPGPNARLGADVLNSLSEAYVNGRAISHTHNRAELNPARRAGLVALDQVFRWILSETTKLIQEINAASLRYNQAVVAGNSMDRANAELDYDAARDALETFERRLKDRSDPANYTVYASAIKEVTIVPISHYNYIVACKVNVGWRGYHSDGSTIHP